MKEFITKLMEDCTGLTVLPANPAPCTGLDVIEVINEFNTDSASGSSTGWTGTYADLATLANDISGVVHAWSSNTIVVLGSASGIVGFHANGENAHFDTALETLAADWAGISGASLPRCHLLPRLSIKADRLSHAHAGYHRQQFRLCLHQWQHA